MAKLLDDNQIKELKKYYKERDGGLESAADNDVWLVPVHDMIYRI